MVLNKRYIRNFRSNLSFFLSITILTALVSCLHVAFDSSYGVQQESFQKLLDEAQLEDAEFMTLRPLDDEKALEEQHHVTIEKQPYIDLRMEEKEVEVRIFAPSSEINLYRVQEGRDVESDTDILLNGLFMERQDLSIGDSITLSGRTYNICGEVIRTDYLFCLKNITDTFSDSDRFGIGVVKDSAFSQYEQEDMATVYAVRYEESTDVSAFRKALNEAYGTLSYVDVGNNSRIQSPKDQFDELSYTVQIILPTTMVFMVLLIAVVLGRKIRNERKMIGVLHALGYKRYELALHYSVLGAIPGILGGLLGILLAIPALTPLSDMLIEDKMEVFYKVTHITWKSSLVALILPTVCYVIAVFITALINMRGSAIDMIKGLAKNKKKRMGLRKAKMSFRTKYKLRAVFGHLPRTLLVIAGIALGGTLVAFTFACVDSIQRYVDTSVKETGDFEYEYFLSSVKTGTPDKGAPVMAASFEVKDNPDLITLMGIDDTSMIHVNDTDGNELTLDEDKFYISEMSAYAYHVKAGDTITIRNIADLKEYPVHVDGIFVNGSQSLMVASRTTVNKLLSMPEDAYTLVMSKEKLPYRDSELLREVSKTSLSEALDKTINQGMKDLLMPITAIAVIISVITTYLMVNILLNESTSVISMLKVLGYRDGEINRIVTYIYHLLLPIGIALGIWLGTVLNRLNFESQTAKYNSFIENYVTPKSIMICVGITLASYVISMFLLSSKVKKVEMVESLKNNAE
ncbi:MAG: ABC transporter permease [Clostridiales bacterium]|nr:ABC transporter permease [Clostridiales bacterium]